MARTVSIVPKLDTSNNYQSFDYMTLFPSVLMYSFLSLGSLIFKFHFGIALVVPISMIVATLYLHFYVHIPLLAAGIFFMQPKYYTAVAKEPYDSMTHYSGVDGLDDDDEADSPFVEEFEEIHMRRAA